MGEWVGFPIFLKTLDIQLEAKDNPKQSDMKGEWEKSKGSF